MTVVVVANQLDKNKITEILNENLGHVTFISDDANQTSEIN